MFLGILTYVLLNWSYTTAVFSDPGSPTSPISSSTTKSGYSHLPTHEPSSNLDIPSFTVKSTGDARFCKKCEARKPDRAHHCSSCKRCVLKMDHHCPWLATCVGHKNYKPFLLFCIYTTVFCWICLGVSAFWLWSEFFNNAQEEQGLLAVNMVLLSVLSGIIGLVMTGFTGWHLSLAWRGQTTIECLEKTRYLSPLRKSMQKQHFGSIDENTSSLQKYGQQLAEIHANALPGVTRVEEGEEHVSPVGDLEQGITARDALGMSYNELERSRERQRYEEYLDEQDSEKLPNAFDLGWKRNLTSLFGESRLLWFFPICNTQGDGWHWEPSPKWLDAREEMRRQREAQRRDQEQRDMETDRLSRQKSVTSPARTAASANTERHYLVTTNGVAPVPKRLDRKSTSKADQILGRIPAFYADGAFLENGPPRHTAKADRILGRGSSQYLAGLALDSKRPGSGMSMKTLRRKSSFDGLSRSVSDDGDGDGVGAGAGNEQYSSSGDEIEPFHHPQASKPSAWSTSESTRKLTRKPTRRAALEGVPSETENSEDEEGEGEEDNWREWD